ncbi:hypothetical protein, partial [Curtobacterium flaccumfaciens]|uniref:hypothetical protein n=1 Tax=Curtobacterium flaccumfaciens TaxID=2035 RepID=UPI001E5B28BB
AEQAANQTDDLLDTVLDLIADRVIEGLRDRGWVEFHRDRPTSAAPATTRPAPTNPTSTEGNTP